MIQTTNYQLKKIELTDAPPDITALNSNWDTLDTEMATLDAEKGASATHRENQVVHITAAERTNWNSKAAASHRHDTAYAPISHSNDTTQHVTATEKQNWNSKAAADHTHSGQYADIQHVSDTTLHLTDEEHTKLANLGATDYVTIVVGISGQHAANTVDFLASTTNAATAINSAIAALPSTGGCVQLLEGYYPLTETVTLNKSHVCLRGMGSSTVLKSSTALTHGLVRCSSPWLCISDLRFTATAGWCISMANAHTTIHDVWFLSSSGCIKADAATDFAQISRCRFSSCDQGVNLLGTNCSVSDNIFTYCDTGLSVNSNFNTIHGNQITECDCGIDLAGGSGNLVIGNVVLRGTGTGSDYSANQQTIHLASGCSKTVVANNVTAGKGVQNDSTSSTSVVTGNAV